MSQGPDLRTAALFLTVILFVLSVANGAERVRLLILIRDTRIDGMRRFFDGEPAVDYTIVMTRNKQMPDNDLLKLIRLYFPRDYREFRKYEVLILSQPTYYLLTTKQDKWIHDTILEGAGGINDGSVFSQVPPIPDSWASGLAWEAFPNDAPAVVAQFGAWASIPSYFLEINKDHAEPVLTVFVPFGVESVFTGVSRVVIPPEGSSVLAWQVGNYPGKKPFLTAWKYGEGRAMTIGGTLPGGWLTYPTGVEGDNRYAPEIMMNMIFWLANTQLIDDVEVFHSVKSDFAEFRTRLGLLISLRDFIERFGANTERIQEELLALDEIYTEAAGQYLEHNFVDSEVMIGSGLALFPEAEEVARREKAKALIWVYVIEWLVSSSTLFISGFVLWTLMVRRRLYRAVAMTKLTAKV